MSLKIENLIKIAMPVVFLTTGISVFGKSTIQKLTSSEKAKAVKEKVAEIASPPRIPMGLKKHSIGIGIGQTFVAGDFDNTGEDQITWDLLYAYSASYSFDLLANFHHSKHKFASQFTQLTSLNLGIKSKFYQIDSFSPFAVGGFGFYAPKVKRLVNNQLLESKTKVVFGYHVGIGGDLKLNEKVSIGLMAQYHNPFDVKQEVGPEVEGRYYKLLITALYTF
jgi:hypothetical protein